MAASLLADFPLDSGTVSDYHKGGDDNNDHGRSDPKDQCPCPQGKSRVSLEHIFKKATKQSRNIIIDLSHSKMKEDVAIKEIKKCFTQASSCRRLKVITRNHNLLEYKK